MWKCCPIAVSFGENASIALYRASDDASPKADLFSDNGITRRWDTLLSSTDQNQVRFTIVVVVYSISPKKTVIRHCIHITDYTLRSKNKGHTMTKPKVLLLGEIVLYDRQDQSPVCLLTSCPQSKRYLELSFQYRRVGRAICQEQTRLY